MAEPFTGSNNCRQYNGRLAYPSAVTGEREFINVEVSFREEIILPSELLPARTLLRDPHSAQAPLSPVNVYVLQRPEAYAEKIRAALTRPNRPFAISSTSTMRCSGACSITAIRKCSRLWRKNSPSQRTTPLIFQNRSLRTFRLS